MKSLNSNWRSNRLLPENTLPQLYTQTMRKRERTEKRRKKGIYDEVTKAYTYLGLESAGYYDYLGKYNNISDFEAQMIKNGVSADLNELENQLKKLRYLHL